MGQSLIGRLAGRTGLTGQLRSAWKEDIKLERERLRELREELTAGLKGLAAEQERMSRTVASLQGSLEEAVAKQERAERRANQFILTAVLNEKQRDHVERLPAVLDPARVSAHVRDAVGRASLITDPFPHIVVDDVVPADVYKTMLRSIPPQDFFGDKDRIKQNLRIPVVGGPDLTLRVWQFVDDVIAREVIVPAVMARFEEPLRGHYRTIFGDAFVARAAALPQSPSGGRVMLRRPGYHLAPHRDPKRSMLTCLMYLAAPGDDESYGTKIFRVSDDHESSYTQTYYPEQNGAACELVKMVPFRPNSMLVFLNGSGAHGADIPADAPADLERYSYQFYVGPSSDALGQLIEDLPDDRRRMWQGKRTATGD